MIDLSALTPREQRIVKAIYWLAILRQHPGLEQHLEVLAGKPTGIDLAIAGALHKAQLLIASGAPATLQPGGAFAQAAPPGVSPSTLYQWHSRLKFTGA